MPIKKINNSGLTLIEVLATIIVLAIASFVISPAVMELANKYKENLYREQVKNILDIASNWFNQNDSKLPPKGDGDIYSIDIETLKRSGLLKREKIKNPLNDKKSMDGDILIYYNIPYKKYLTIYCDSEYGNKYYNSDRYAEVMDLCNRPNITKVEELSD